MNKQLFQEKMKGFEMVFGDSFGLDNLYKRPAPAQN